MRRIAYLDRNLADIFKLLFKLLFAALRYKSGKHKVLVIVQRVRAELIKRILIYKI